LVLTAGHLLGNRYRLDERIATGGMGDVWRGTDVVLGRVIAVKVLRTAMMSDPEFAARFYGEARMMAAFRHPGVVEVYDYASAAESGDADDGVAYLVMAYVEGEPLSTRVKQGPMPVTEVMSIVAQAADALHAAHENGTVHRDVKPGNLIVKPNGTVVLVDFGVARSAAVTSVTAVNAIVGTALYMAPEQVAKGNVSAATDIYALGAVAYHCIAGVPPFDGDNALQVALRHLEDEPDPLPDYVPLEVRELIQRAMAKQPADRFQTAAEFAEAAFAAAGPLDWKRLTGTSIVNPLSPAAPTRAVPLPRDLSPTPPPTASMTATAPGAQRRPRSQTALLVAVVALLIVAGGLAFAIAMNNRGDEGKNAVDNQNPASSSQPVDQATTDESDPPSEVPTVRSTKQGNLPSRTPTPSASASQSAPTSAPTSKPPTSKPTTTPPTTTPATTPATTPPTTPATTPTTDDPGEGGGGGTNP
jgi:serine/threonine protein kinase